MLARSPEANPFKCLKRKIKALFGNEEGVTAVEFALVGPIMLGMIFSAIELGLLLTKIALLDNATGQISRTIYTGAASNGVVTQKQLVDEICYTISIIDDGCSENLAIELTPITDFHSIPNTGAACIDSDEPIKPTVNYDPGASNNIVYMRVCLTSQVYTPGIGFGLQLPKTGNGKIQIVSSLAFSNEPF